MTDSDHIVVTCPNCQELLRVRSVLAGKRTRCPKQGMWECTGRSSPRGGERSTADGTRASLASIRAARV